MTNKNYILSLTYRLVTFLCNIMSLSIYCLWYLRLVQDITFFGFLLFYIFECLKHLDSNVYVALKYVNSIYNIILHTLKSNFLQVGLSDKIVVGERLIAVIWSIPRSMLKEIRETGFGFQRSNLASQSLITSMYYKDDWLSFKHFNLDYIFRNSSYFPDILT